MFNFVNPLQPLNALYPMLVMLFGIVMDVIDALSLKQLSYISSTVLLDSVDGTATSVAPPKYLINMMPPFVFSAYIQSVFCCGKSLAPQTTLKLPEP